MALATSVTGTGSLVSYSNTVRNLRDAGETFYNWEETIINEVREWEALTESAANTAVTAGTGEASMTFATGTGTTYANDSDEDNRVLGSYSYKCSAEKKTIAFV